jgi:hypothetical protein
MGIEYSLVNHKNQTYFDLGKGGWSVFNHHLKDLFLFQEVYEDFSPGFEDPESEETKEYIRNIVDNIIKFVGDADLKYIEITADCDEYHAYMRNYYTCIGSRYGLGNAEKNKGYIEENNQIKGKWTDKHSEEWLKSVKKKFHG